MENTRKPQILIQTDGIQNTKVFVDGKELTGVAGIRFSQSYKENKGLPVLQIDLKATNITLDTKVLPALPDGAATAALDEIIKLATNKKKKAVRLDAIGTNVPAQKLYEKYGFVNCGTAQEYYESTGETEFVFYEYALAE